MLDTVVLGAKVLLRDMEYEINEVYSIVNATDANSLKKKLSDQSPIGKAILGKKVGEVITVNVGNSSVQFKILEIKGFAKGYEPKKKSQSVQKTTDNTNMIIKNVLAKDFVVRVHVFRCSAENHKLVDIICRVRILNKEGKIETHLVPGAYCRDCDRYFILDADYQRLKEKGILVCKVVEEEFWSEREKENDYNNLSQESTLHMLGYNVNVQTNISKEQRWRLLEIIIDEGVLTAMEVRSHLNWLIRRSKNVHNLDDARLKWEVDVEHISIYAKNPDSIVDVKSITSNKTINQQR